MIAHYFKTAFRNILKSRTFSAINIFGLAISIACAILVILHVKEELSYDKNYAQADRIFRITQEDIGNDNRHWAATAPPLAPALKASFPEIQQSVRLHRLSPYPVLSFKPLHGDVKRFEEKGGFLADAPIIEVFDINLVMGDRHTCLSGKNNMVISEAMAVRYFGNQNPLGKTITDDNANVPFKITGVFKPHSFATHLQFDYLLSMPSMSSYQDDATMQRKTWSGFYTYVLLRKADDRKMVENRMNDFMLKFYASTGETTEEILSKRKLHLQPVTAIHLHSRLEKEMYPNSDVTYVYVFSIAALFIILIAAMNFINMSTAAAFNRVKEIGVRKAAGATKKQLVFQFLGESFLMTLMATLLSLTILQVAIKPFNHISGATFQLADMLEAPNLTLLVILVMGIGLLAGLYPAYFISNFNSADSLKGKSPKSGTGVLTLRKGLIVFQFVISVFMIFSTLVVYRQLQYFHKKDIGFDKEHLVAVKLYGDTRNNLPALFNQIRHYPGIKQYATVSALPGERFGTLPFIPAGNRDDDEGGSVRIMWADDKLLSTLQIRLKEGRNFFEQFPDIKTHEFLLNESAVKTFRLKDPIGKQFVADNRDTGTVVGIVGDFNFASLHSAVDPLVIQYHPYRSSYLVIKVAGGKIPETLDFLEKSFKNIAPSSVFSYSFVDEQVDRLYAAENRLSAIFRVFAGFAIFISCLGLFGISAYTARVRTKEVGIRKVLGASVPGITLLLSIDFIKLVLVAILIALPAAWWTMQQWLDGFAYRININPLIFLLSGISAIVVAMLTVGMQGVKAALENPVNSLKSE